jgi:hypothetical protein
LVNPRIEKNRLKKEVEKLENLEKMEGEKFTLEIENLPKENETKIKKYLSNRKVKYFSKTELKKGVKIFKIVINVEKNWRKTLFDFLPKEILKIESVIENLGLEMRILEENPKIWIRKIKKNIQLFEKKDLSFIRSFSQNSNKDL